ncbi:bifunctional chorismate mutase/prephenate dehydratase [[Clostridium] polysaccharolyticum]|uniref:Bifunctional chorismate mutase/prephenate dehydratase n=1 Tax=[Clostridium] polysaccharolyticum TaxID=29364 RepID=A0A1I0EXV6_9FIRM|nr:bifunctional chorismate mutase/prephenate dehydratase [[Clostridium] polysaccharolyticum]SET50479.1 chorismate mutase [[Clostridium] polysaccharolyticum]
MDLKESREKIDSIDKQIAELIQERMGVSVEVAKYKKETGKKIFDKVREQEILEKLGGMAKDEFNRQGVQEIYAQIMSISRKLQYSLLKRDEAAHNLEPVKSLNLNGKKVVFFGEHGAYTEQAMFEFFGEKVESYSVKTFKEVMEELKLGNADYGVLPIENSSTGGITDCFDLLIDYDNYIIGEHEIKVNQCLLGLPGAKAENLTRVFSHEQGLMQCASFLEKYPKMEQVPYMSTAISAKKVAQEQNLQYGAIASKRAAEYYGLEVLQENINYEALNATRFIIIAREPIYLEDSNKVSICVQLPHECGSLHNMISHFIYNNLNMTKIESRPIQGKKWEYRFFVEFEGNFQDSGVQNALYGIQEEASKCRILGNFKTV